MNTNDRNILNIYPKLATDEYTKEKVLYLLDLKLDELNKDKKDLEEKIFWYEKLKEEIIKKEV